tara:strand:- start:923 stop:1513 length:591 start_codon:yes stop_codon:yes gene_type:complete
MASSLKMNYSLFFGYMKTMYKLDYQHVTTDFYLVEQSSGEQCFIEQAEIVVDQKREPIEFEKLGKLMPFYSDEHRKDGAMIDVKTVNNEACALQVTLMAKESELNKLSFQRLLLISSELEGVLRKNAGMIGKYFLPTYVGLRFKLVTPLASDFALPSGYVVAPNGDLLVSNETLMAEQSSQLLAYKVARISPWIGE